MNIAIKALVFIFLAIHTVNAHGETDTRQKCFSPEFKSLQVRLNGNADAPAVIIAGSSDRLSVSFDELSTQARNLRWSLTHCNAQWQPEELSDFEFTDGLNEATVDDYEYSRSTLTHYVHYSITLPDERMPLKISGNYLLKVYEEYEPENILLQARFSVVENTMRVNASVSPRTDIDYMDRHQQLEIEVETKGSGINNPYTDLITIIEQNPGGGSRITLPTPSMMRGSTVVYSHLRPLIFKGGNEYRRFETVSTSYPGMGVDRIGHTPEGYVADLLIDTPRYSNGYIYDRTQHGAFTIREYNSDNSDTEAEYVLTNFTFESPEFPGAEVHIDGELTSHALDSSTHMEYDPEIGCYRKSLLLKQGAYDYRYVTVSPGSTVISTDFTEGNYCDTSNQYIIYVYYRNPGERYDRLAAVTATALHK